MRGGSGAEPPRCPCAQSVPYRWSWGAWGAGVTSGTQSALQKDSATRCSPPAATQLCGGGGSHGGTRWEPPPCPHIPVPPQHSPESLWSPSGPRDPAGKRKEGSGGGWEQPWACSCPRPPRGARAPPCPFPILGTKPPGPLGVLKAGRRSAGGSFGGSEHPKSAGKYSPTARGGRGGRWGRWGQPNPAGNRHQPRAPGDCALPVPRPPPPKLRSSP